MERLTYKQAYNLIIEAYFKDEIKPMNANFCFCGTLAQGIDFSWRRMYFGDAKPNKISFYTGEEYLLMEHALLTKLNPEDKSAMPHTVWPNKKWTPTSTYEEDLFEGMCAALDVLKQIHKERGEDVDEDLKLTKRKLQTA